MINAQDIKKEKTIAGLENIYQEAEGQMLALKAEHLNGNIWQSKEAKLEAMTLDIRLKEIKERIKYLQRNNKITAKNKTLSTIISSLATSNQTRRTRHSYYMDNREQIKQEREANRIIQRVNAEHIAATIEEQLKAEGSVSLLDQLKSTPHPTNSDSISGVEDTTMPSDILNVLDTEIQQNFETDYSKLPKAVIDIEIENTDKKDIA